MKTETVQVLHNNIIYICTQPLKSLFQGTHTHTHTHTLSLSLSPCTCLQPSTPLPSLSHTYTLEWCTHIRRYTGYAYTTNVPPDHCGALSHLSCLLLDNYRCLVVTSDRWWWTNGIGRGRVTLVGCWIGLLLLLWWRHGIACTQIFMQRQ